MIKDKEFEDMKKLDKSIIKLLKECGKSPKRKHPKGSKYIKVNGYYKGRGDFIFCDKCGQGHWEHKGTYVRPHLKRNPNTRK